MNSNNTTPKDSQNQDNGSPQNREPKVLLSIKSGESWDEFKKRVIEKSLP
ncbi:MAG: hypothetical protein JO053_04805 [Acidobacteria bacterium]|nr:hypothetical protein [Acidobacteriota bacterium]